MLDFCITTPGKFLLIEQRVFRQKGTSRNSFRHKPKIIFVVLFTTCFYQIQQRHFSFFPPSLYSYLRAPALLRPFISPSQISLHSSPACAFMLTFLHWPDETAHWPLWAETHALLKLQAGLLAGGCGEFCVFFRPTVWERANLRLPFSLHAEFISFVRLTCFGVWHFRDLQLGCEFSFNQPF